MKRTDVSSSASSDRPPASDVVDDADDRTRESPAATLAKVAVILAGAVKRNREARKTRKQRAS